MLSPQFNFPPESYSAVYNAGGDVTNANTNKVCEIEATPTSPESNTNHPSPSLLNCFDCAFRNSIKVLRKEKKARKPKEILATQSQVDLHQQKERERYHF